MKSAIKSRVILLFGMPGSGKGTQGKALGNLPGFLHMATGDIFRTLNPLGVIGRQVADFLAKGMLVPDEMSITIWRQHLEQMQAQGRYNLHRHILILDGMPRTRRQAELLDQEIEVLKIFYLVLRNEQDAIERIKDRSRRDHRSDDGNEAVIRSRLETFRQDTLATLSFYDPQLVDEIDASQPAMAVLHELSGKICNLTCHLD